MRIISIEVISVGRVSVGEMSCRQNIRVVGEMSVGDLSGRRNVLVSSLRLITEDVTLAVDSTELI